MNLIIVGQLVRHTWYLLGYASCIINGYSTGENVLGLLNDRGMVEVARISPKFPNAFFLNAWLSKYDTRPTKQGGQILTLGLLKKKDTEGTTFFREAQSRITNHVIPRVVMFRLRRRRRAASIRVCGYRHAWEDATRSAYRSPGN